VIELCDGFLCFREFLFSSDGEEEEEIFAGFTVKEIKQLREQQR